ncbi:MAG: PQQ-binding-like beta-propeller repeat protein [Planctomycetota bacterium]|nr:PQQ-binding-like beta-propeller repeat protein [Planctomycetota bacterium]
MRDRKRTVTVGVIQRAVWIVVVGLVWTGVVSGQDWRQWQGPNRDGVWPETGTIDQFPDDGPNVLWRAPLANGFSGPAVFENRLFVTDFVSSGGDDTPDPGKKSELSGSERVHCLDCQTGKPLWVHEDRCDYKISYPNGPRATPTVDGDRVYTLGAEGRLNCLKTENGAVLWTRDLKKDYEMDLAPHWGFAAHPLVDGDTLYCVVGGKGSVAVAFDKMTGQERWRALDAVSPGYCPPTMIEAGGTKQLLIWHPESLNSLNPETGEVYWSFPMKPAYEMSIIAPIHYQDYLYAVALQGTSVLLKLSPDEPAVTEIWQGKGVHPDHNPPLVVEGNAYGIDVKGHLRCVDLKSGERLWESLATAPQGRPASSATGFMVRNGEKFFVVIETGDLLIAKMSADGYQELDRAHILEPTSRTGNRKVVWSHPAFANRCMFARNDKEIVCVSLAE